MTSNSRLSKESLTLNISWSFPMSRKNARTLSRWGGWHLLCSSAVERSRVEHHLWEQKLMNGFHKGHNIIISAARTGKLRQWKTHVKVIWSDDGLGKVSTLEFNGVFREKTEAERGGLIVAKKWIDDGKPDRTLEER
jgi:hypothetical protein